MKKNKIFGLSLILLALTFIYIGTYAYYMNVVSGSISANTGGFVFDVLYNNATFKSIDLAKTTGDESKTFIVPGDKGKFDLVAKANGSSVNIEYTISFNSTSVPTNMKFYLDEAKTKVLDIQTDKISDYLLTSGTMEKSHTIYWEWPYDSGEYNDLDIQFQNKKIEVSVNIVGKQLNIYTYGVKRDTNSTSPAWERINDSVGLVANAVTNDNTNPRNDFDNIYPWSDIKSYNYDATTKEVTAWIGDSNFKFDGTNGEVLTYIPGFYYKREVVDGIEYQYISKYNKDGYSYSEPFSVGRYEISGGKNSYSAGYSSSTGNPNDFKARSISGVYASAESTIETFRASAQKLGNEFSLMDYHWFIIQQLYLVEYANYDSQTVLGEGRVYGTSGGTQLLGQETNSLGMKSGCLINNGSYNMIYRGIEGLYGNVHEFIDGINIKDNQAYINYDYKTFASDVFDGNYKALGYVNSNANGYITKLGYDSNNPLIGLPIAVQTESDNSITDYYEQKTGNAVLITGGDYDSIDKAGMYSFKANFIAGSINNSASTGSRLIRHHSN